jgi:hypothetical protein
MIRIEYASGNILVVPDAAGARKVLRWEYPDAVFGEWGSPSYHERYGRGSKDIISSMKKRAPVWKDLDHLPPYPGGPSILIAEIVEIEEAP